LMSYWKIGKPWLGASASRMLRGTIVSNTLVPKWRRISSATSRERFVRSSYMVSRMPAITRWRLRPPWTLSTVDTSSLIPSSAKYSHWRGTMTPSAAVSALTVRWPSDGGQSRRIVS